MLYTENKAKQNDTDVKDKCEDEMNFEKLSWVVILKAASTHLPYQFFIALPE